MLIKQLTPMVLFFFLSPRFLFPLDSLVRLKEQPCVPLFSLRISKYIIPLEGHLLAATSCVRQKIRQERREMLGRRNHLSKSFDSGSFNHMSRGDVWHLSPFQLESSSPQGGQSCCAP